MKSHGSSARLLPTTGRKPTASPLTSSAFPSSSVPTSSRMSPSGGKKLNRQASHNSNVSSNHESGASSSFRAPPLDAYAYSMEAAAMMANPMLFQLQQFQQQQQQQNMAALGYQPNAMPPMAAGYPSHYMQPPAMMSRVSCSNVMPDDHTSNRYEQAPPNSNAAVASPSQPPTRAAIEKESKSIQLHSDDDVVQLMQRLEKKDEMIAQLGTFLAQMKQESEGTAMAWKDKMREVADLKIQVGSLSDQLQVSQEQTRSAAEQLAHTTEELQRTRQALQEGETRHLEELTIMNDEVTKRQKEADHMKIGFEQSLQQVTQELIHTQQSHRESVAQCESLQNSVRSMEEGHALVINQLEEEKTEMKSAIQTLGQHLSGLESEKQELGQHLWNATQELEAIKQHCQQMERQCAQNANDSEQSRAAWTERFQQLQSEKAELLGVQAMLQTNIEEITSKFETERSQKEELNALMGTEMQRMHDDTMRLEHEYQQTIIKLTEERDQWQVVAMEHQQAVEHLEVKCTRHQTEFDQQSVQIQQITAENQFLQQNGTEKSSTLQELNEQLRQTLESNNEIQARYELLHAQWEQVDKGVRECVQALSAASGGPKTKDATTTGFPESLFRAVQDSIQANSMIDQMKITTLRLQQDQDNTREAFRQREQELLSQCKSLQDELETTKTDAKALAQEIQQLSRVSGGNEAKLSMQVQQLTKALDEARSSTGMQMLQLQKSLDSQRSRSMQLESEKKELLQEAEHLNSSMEALYQAKNEKQIELDQLRGTWKELQLQYSDLKENFEDTEASAKYTIEELNSKIRSLQGELQEIRTLANAMDSEKQHLEAALNQMHADCDSISRQYGHDQGKWQDKEREMEATLQEKTRRMDEMMEMLTQLRAKTDSLEKARATEDNTTRKDLEIYQQQILLLTQDKKRFELGYTNLKAQQDQASQELFTLKEEKRHWMQTQSDLDEELGALRAECSRLSTELERVTRARSSLQMELHRMIDDAQDAQRQLEVVRRDSRAQEKKFLEEIEKLRREAEDLRVETSESSATAEELQTKMTSIQNAANATINDLMAELQHAQDSITYDKTRLVKENETLRSQLKSIDDDLRRKESDLKELHATFRQERDHLAAAENELTIKVSRLSNALETKKQEAEKLSKELEGKTLKVAEYERKLTPLMHAKEQSHAKLSELKQELEAKARELHEVEEKAREDLSRVVKDKREMETLYLTMKEDYDVVKSQTSGHQHQWANESKLLKQAMERTKSELIKANAEVQSLAQRLETCQIAANETITDLSARLHGAEQQKELALNALQREIHVERERRREAESQKMELQRQLRQQRSRNGSSGSSGTSAADRFEDGEWAPVASSYEVNPSAPPPKPLAAPLATAPAPSPVAQKDAKASPHPQYRKFYANEPMTNAELSNLPMAVIKAQMGLEFSSAGSSNPVKGQSRAPSLNHEDNNESIPLLPLEKLPQ